MEAGNECNSRIVPERVMEAVKRTLVNVEELRTNFDEFLSLSDPEVQAEMPPLQRAQSLLLLAKAASTLFTVRLRCNGVQPDDHPIKRELCGYNSVFYQTSQTDSGEERP
ncbi:hypothetical protein Nepgr_012403 [Nepenthes gracilis]|uniref:Nuclear nucleic acid-binding protein C1D n=1 Tax=Nepenthes gracilis TaxID=150966 RepID=A0AAD3SH96_NEPGR|nr:hypothetical protein Nepgr_012403 [Nepenthes gracilis]